MLKKEEYSDVIICYLLIYELLIIVKRKLRGGVNSMPEINLKELYSHMQKEMDVKLHTGESAFVHPGTKGDESEANWIVWLKNYLPKRYAIDKGIVTDSFGKQSDQIRYQIILL